MLLCLCLPIRDIFVLNDHLRLGTRDTFFQITYYYTMRLSLVKYVCIIINKGLEVMLNMRFLYLFYK